MATFDVDSVDPNDSRSINISVYKPDGILSFWNWFTKRNKAQVQRKHLKLQINKEDLEKIKLSGFDFQKLQNLNLNNKDKSKRQGNMFTIPKTDLDPFLVKHLQPTMNTKTFVKRLISKSTLSIRSKDSCADLKYTCSVKSQKSVGNSVQSSKTSFKMCMRSDRNGNVPSNQNMRNVLLKSVPTTILKSNTKKLLVPGKVKSPRAIRKVRTTDVPENIRQQYAKASSNVLPMLLTRIKSMEEQLSDIENTTNKINEAVSQRNVVKTEISRKDLSYNSELGRQRPVKCVASHKIYSKNIHSSRKNKKNRSRKFKNKSKSNLSSNEVSSKLKHPNKGFHFNYFSDSSNEVKNVNGLGHNKKPGLIFNQQGFTLPSNMTAVELCPGNNGNVGCDFLLSVVKALTEAKGSTNLKQMSSSTTQDKPQCPNITTELGVTLERRTFPSKSTFDWRHSSVSTTSEPLISETVKTKQESVKVKKNLSVNFGNQDLHHVPCERNDILSSLFDPKLQKESELLRINTTKSLSVRDETKITGVTQTYRSGKPSEIIEVPNLDEEYERRYGNGDHSCNNNHEMGFQNEKSVHCTNVSGSHKETNDLGLEQEGFLTNVAEERSGKRSRNLQPCDRNGSDVTKDQAALCSVSIGLKQDPVSAAFTNSQDKQFKRTTISCSNAQKEPKVSITILVQDSMKDNVEMKSNLLKSPAFSKDERVEESPKETYSPALSCKAGGDQLSNVNVCKTDSLFSLDNVSSVSRAVIDTNINIPVPKTTVDSRANKNFFVEVKDSGRKNAAEVLGSPGTYLNREKRKVLEEKVLGLKHNRSLVEDMYEKNPLSPTRSCSLVPSRVTSFDQLIETSIIRQETSYSKTKFNICKENKYNSRTTLTQLENCKRCIFSDESPNTENNFNVSTKYTSQQSVMYSRNNNVAHFQRPKCTLFQENSLDDTEFEQRKEPFIVVHTPNKNVDNLIVKTNNKRSTVRQTGTDLRFHEDSIIEVSEEESVVEKQTDEQIEITTTRSDYGLINNLKEKCDKGGDRNRVDDSDRRSRVNQRVPHHVGQTQLATEANRQCPINSKKGECHLSQYDVKDTDFSTNEPENRRGTLSLSQTVLSSAFVQTDWSLLGITEDHLNMLRNKSDYKGRTVATQTDEKMDQIALRHKECEGCMRNNQFNELVACNVTMPQAATLQEVPHDRLSRDGQRGLYPLGKQDVELAGMLMDIINENNSFFDTCGTLLMRDNVVEKATEQVKSATLLSTNRTYSSSLNPASESHENKNEEIYSTMMFTEDLMHRCNNPCLSDENLKPLLAKSDPEGYSRVPEIHAINRGICEYYSSSDDIEEVKQPLPTEESRPSRSDSASCRMLGDLDINQLLQDQNDTASRALSVIPEEAVGDAIIDGLSLCADPDVTATLEDDNERSREEIQLEHTSKTKKGNEPLKVQRRKTSFKNIMPSKEVRRGCCSISKTNDPMIKPVGKERFGNEIKGTFLQK